MINTLLRMVVVAAGVLALNGAVLADETLARKSFCMTCHNVNLKGIGPSYKDIAKKYGDEAEAVTTLSKKVKEGSKGVWGLVPMPPNPQVSDADIKTIVTWILNGAARAFKVTFYPSAG